jgi:prolyl-tRNA editing enzyme YbaK/EbsC (Cys-tRNA(Pro) deacylase)
VDPLEARVRAEVDRLAATGLDVGVIDIDPALADTAEFCAAYGYASEDSANAIVVIGKSDPPVYAMCVVLATTRLDVNKAVRKRLGTKKASFAPADATRELTGMSIGGVTPLARPDALPLWVDAAVTARQRIIVGGGSRGCKVLGPPEILTVQPGAEVVEGLATPIDATI